MESGSLKKWMLRAAKFLAARSPFMIGWVLSRMSFALPVERLYETERLLAFSHPAPAYGLHVLLVPKQPVANLMALDAQAQQAFLVDVFSAAQVLVARFGLEEGGYRLVLNGGAYQEFPYLHFHLVA